MGPFLYLSFLLFSTVSLAELLSLRSSSKELAPRPRPPSSYHFQDSLSSNTHDDNHDEAELLDIVLVASVDGKFRALNRTSGQTLWAMSSLPSKPGTSVPSTLGPLVRTVHQDYDPEVMDEGSVHETYIIEPQSGDIYVMTTPSSPLQRFPYSMSELVDLSPFSPPSPEDRRVFVARKETSLLLVELETGKIKATLNSECPWDPVEDVLPIEHDNEDAEESKYRSQPATEVFIGRTDYHISIIRPHVKGPQREQKLSFSTYGPNNQDVLVQAAYRRTKDDTYIQGLPNGEIISLRTGKTLEDGTTAQPQPLWARQFESPVVAVFDVMRTHRQPHLLHTYVLLQPRPGLRDLGASLSLDTAPGQYPNFQSAYVGMVEENGSLFAMSPFRYPLVAFGDSSRAAQKELASPLRTDISSDTDVASWEMEEARLAARCESSHVFDRKCLVGVRRLQGGDGEGPDSRLRRLLDASLADSVIHDPRIDIPPSPSPPLPTTNVTQTSTPIPLSEPTSIRHSWRGHLLEGLVTLFLLLSVSSWWFGFGRLRGSLLLSQTPGQVDNPFIESEIVLPDARPTVSLSTQESAPFSPKLSDDVDDSEVEDDNDAHTGVKKKRGRGRRAKKKKADSTNGKADKESSKVFPIAPPTPKSVLEPVPPLTTSLVLPETPKPMAPSLVVSDTVLGFGSHGTVVYQGSLQGRAVAVKRLLHDFVTLASREVSILQESDDHPNVIRYYYQESHGNFLYIALELCPASLADIIECPDREQFRELSNAFNPKKALRQITSGLRHLHALKLVHRDIKPQNILISAPAPGNTKAGHRMLISDFGLCKKLDVDQTSFLPTAYGAQAAGTVGWRAPEILRGEVKLDDIGDGHSSSSVSSTSTATGASTARPTRLTKSVDIFALGCLYYYTLTNGCHPFGDRYEREVNILKDSKDLKLLEQFGEEGSEAVDLVERMLDPQACKRPDTTTCLAHPYFWTPGQRLNFLQDASDRFEIMCRDPKDANLVALETDAPQILGPDWQTRVDKTFLDNLGKFRKYDGKSVQDLLRALRNKKHHYQDLPENVKRHLGPMPEGYLGYFTKRYPRLFLHVHSVIRGTPLRSESMFRSYFEIAE